MLFSYWISDKTQSMLFEHSQANEFDIKHSRTFLFYIYDSQVQSRRFRYENPILKRKRLKEAYFLSTKMW